MGSEADKQSWEVHKFGGTSVADADCFRRVSALLHAQEGPRLAVVVSAMGGMTNALLERVAEAEKSSSSIAAGIDAIRQRYLSTVNELIGSEEDSRSLLEPVPFVASLSP